MPTTILILLFSAKSGELAPRIGPRPQLTVGPLLVAAGLLLLSRLGTDASWARDLLPGAIVFGLGLATFVAPLTATVMGSVSPDEVGIASGVNDATARTASLAALSVTPVVSGSFDATGPAEVTDAFRISLVIAAVIAAAAAPLSVVGLDTHVRARPSARRTSCSVDGPPLQPDRTRCPVAVAH